MFEEHEDLIVGSNYKHLELISFLVLLHSTLREWAYQNNQIFQYLLLPKLHEEQRDKQREKFCHHDLLKNHTELNVRMLCVQDMTQLFVNFLPDPCSSGERCKTQLCYLEYDYPTPNGKESNSNNDYSSTNMQSNKVSAQEKP